MLYCDTGPGSESVPGIKPPKKAVGWVLRLQKARPRAVRLDVQYCTHLGMCRPRRLWRHDRQDGWVAAAKIRMTTASPSLPTGVVVWTISLHGEKVEMRESSEPKPLLSGGAG